jgi:hypothetical protein
VSTGGSIGFRSGFDKPIGHGVARCRLGADQTFNLRTAVGDPSRTLESKQWRGFLSFLGNCGAVTFWVTAPPPKNPLRTANLSLESSANCRF